MAQLTQTPARKTYKVRPGAKLLCIDDRNIRRTYVPGPPVKGHIYCVREIYEDAHDQGRVGVLLLGIEGPVHNKLEQGFYLTRFKWVHD